MAKKDIEKQMSEELGKSIQVAKAEREAKKPKLTAEDNESYKALFGHDMPEYIEQQAEVIGAHYDQVSEESQPTAKIETSQNKEDLEKKYPYYDYNKGKKNSSTVHSKLHSAMLNWKPNPDVVHNQVFGFLHRELEQQLLQKKAFVRKYLNGRPYDCIPMHEIPDFKSVGKGGKEATKKAVPTPMYLKVRQMFDEGKITLKTKHITL